MSYFPETGSSSLYNTKHLNSATYTIAASESGTNFFNGGYLGNPVVTLPPATPGLQFVFSRNYFIAFSIYADGSDTLQYLTTTGQSGFWLASNGAQANVFCLEAGKWIITSSVAPIILIA